MLNTDIRSTPIGELGRYSERTTPDYGRGGSDNNNSAGAMADYQQQRQLALASLPPPMPEPPAPIATREGSIGLPAGMNHGSGGFVNDQHRAIVDRGRHAAQTFQMPQNTQLPMEAHEDETAIEAVLQQLGGGRGQDQRQGQQQQLQMRQQLQMQQQQLQQQQEDFRWQQEQFQRHREREERLRAQEDAEEQQDSMVPPPFAPSNAAANIRKFTIFDVLRICLVCAVCFVATHLVPFDVLIGKIDALAFVLRVRHGMLLLRMTAFAILVAVVLVAGCV